MGSEGQSQPTNELRGSKTSPLPRRRRLAGRAIVPIITLLLGIVLGFMTLLLYVLYVFSVLSNAPPEHPVTVPPSPSSGDIVVQISPTYMVNVLRPILQKELSSFPLPNSVQLPLPCNYLKPLPCNIPVLLPPNTQLSGTINNVQIMLSDSDSKGYVLVTTTAACDVTISSDLAIIGSVTTGAIPMTVKLMTQLFVQNGQLMANVQPISIVIELNGSPHHFFIESFKSTIEDQIDQQLKIKTRDLPPGFDYRIIGVRSKPEGVYVTLSATPK
jgi:hypothetical protein